MSAPIAKAKTLGKGLVNTAIDATGLFERRVQRLQNVPCWIVITYHRVLEDDHTFDPYELGMCTRKRDFEAQLQLLKQYFDIRKANDVIAACHAGDALSKPTVSITFDDGYLDNYDVALPILRELELQATLFVATGDLGSAQMLWWDRVIFAIHQASAASLDLRGFEIPGCDRPIALSPQHKKQALESLLNGLWAASYSSCINAVGEVERQLGVSGDSKWAPRMGPEQLRAFSNEGMEIGAHSINHHDMSDLDEASLQHELREPKRALEALLDVPVTGLAYPAGRYSDAVIAASKSAGYDYAMSTVRRFNNDPLENSYAIRRMVIGNNDLKDFKRCFSGLAAQLL